MEDDPFQLLGLPQAFGIDRARVESAYLTRIAELHPDLAAGDPDATAKTAGLNRARTILGDDEQRAVALLGLLGGPGGDALPDGFLMEIMDIRMQIEDELGDPEARTTWRAWADRRREGHMERVARFFESTTPDSLAAVRMELNAWLYTERLIEQLDPDHRGPGRPSADEPL